jgi:hypothetical protein
MYLQGNRQNALSSFLNVYVTQQYRKFLYVSSHNGIIIREHESKILLKAQSAFVHTVNMFCLA